MRLRAAAFALLVLAGCTKVGTESATGPAGGERHPWTTANSLRIGISGSPNTLNPILPANTTEAMLNRLSFDLLVTVDPAGKQQPDLASEVPTLENGGISKDGLTIAYHLRKNVKWHDGVPFTSKDVKFTFDAIMNDKNNVIARTGYVYVKSVETPDDATVIFHLKRPFSPFVNTVFGESDSAFCVIPAHLLAKYPNVNDIPFNHDPVGTGPFKIVRWVRGDHIEYVANDDYFLGKPKIKTVTVKIVPDENTMIAQLKTHEIDWMFEASPQLYAQLKTLPEIKNVLVDQNQYLGMLINTSRPLLADVRVRRALAYAVDKNKLVEQFTYGSATVATEDLPSFLWAYNPDVPKYGYDPAKAKALLAQAGWTPGADGVLRKGSERLALTLSYNVESATRRLVAVQVQAWLKAVGIDVQVKTYPGSLLFAAYGAGGILNTGKYDLNISGWIAGVDPDDSSQFTCAALPPKGTNYTRYCTPAMDAAQNSALSQYAQPARKKAYATIQNLLAQDVPQVFFWWPRQIQPINPDFKGFAPNPVTESWNAYQWEI